MRSLAGQTLNTFLYSSLASATTLYKPISSGASREVYHKLQLLHPRQWLQTCTPVDPQCPRKNNSIRPLSKREFGTVYVRVREGTVYRNKPNKSGKMCS